MQNISELKRLKSLNLSDNQIRHIGKLVRR